MAKILIVTYTGYGNWFSLQLEQEGHSVDIWYCDNYDDYGLVLDGLVSRPFKTRPDFRKYDLVMFDLTGRPKIAEEVISLGIPCIGDSDLSSELEDNRLFGIEVMEECDINVPFYEVFEDLGEAKKFVRKTKKRYVFKPDGGQEQDTASTYVSKDAEDLLRYLDKLENVTKGTTFILQEVVNGTEISTEAWFNGEEFFLINGTLEEKKFMNDNKGPNTGCAGNLVWIYDQINPPGIFKEGLAKLKDFLQSARYHGMVDLNTIVSDSKIYGLEWTPRFGYDASATLYSCLNNCLGDFIGAVASGAVPECNYNNSFAAAIRLSIPPYPSEIKNKHPEGIPIEGIDEDDIPKNCFLYDCCSIERDELCTAGINGFIAVPIQAGNSIAEAWGRVQEKVKKIQIPNMQHRTDLEKTTTERYNILARQGWLR